MASLGSGGLYPVLLKRKKNAARVLLAAFLAHRHFLQYTKGKTACQTNSALCFIVFFRILSGEGKFLTVQKERAKKIKNA